MKETLRRPLITGASVSADYGAKSPGKRLALRYTSASQIVTLAASGSPARAVVPRLTPEVLRDRTAVIALDLFFWDSTLEPAADSLDALKLLFERVSAVGVPLIVGDIPALLPGRQPARDTLNQAIRRSCEAYEPCRVLKLDELHRQVKRDGYLDVRGRRYLLHELVPDGLHLNDIASDAVADRLLQTLASP